jgi:hypothetical protein
MALFGPQARLERCLWWANLTGWPKGISEERRSNCYDKVFGRKGYGQPTPGSRVMLERQQEVEPKNDLLALIAIAIGIVLVWKYLLKK